jgi:hypothetical protein
MISLNFVLFWSVENPIIRPSIHDFKSMLTHHWIHNWFIHGDFTRISAPRFVMSFHLPCLATLLQTAQLLVDLTIISIKSWTIPLNRTTAWDCLHQLELAAIRHLFLQKAIHDDVVLSEVMTGDRACLRKTGLLPSDRSVRSLHRH